MSDNVRDAGERWEPHTRETEAEGDARSSADREIEAAVDLMPVAAFICDRDQGTALYSNPLLQSLQGVKREEFIGRRITGPERGV